MKLLTVVIATLAIATTTPARAGTAVTLNANVAPVFREGELQGCTIVFDVTRRDIEYRQGKWIHVAGSLSFYVFPNRAPSFALKLGTKALDSQSEQYEAPAEAFLISGNETNKADAITSFDAEIPGFRMFGFRAGDATMDSVMDASGSGKLKIGYAFRAGGMLAPFEVDLTMKRLNLDAPEASETNRRAPEDWLQCLEDALKRGEARLRNH